MFLSVPQRAFFKRFKMLNTCVAHFYLLSKQIISNCSTNSTFVNDGTENTLMNGLGSGDM